MGVVVRGRAGSGVLVRLRAERLVYLRRNWLRATVLVVGFLLTSLLLLAIAWFSLGQLPQLRSPVIAFSCGALLMGGMWFWWWFLALDDSHYKRRGAWAEQWTSEELKKLRLEGRWVLHNRIDFDGFDVDHVLVGPTGLFVIETKWRAKRNGRPIPISRHTLRFDLAQTQASADAIQERLAAADIHLTPRRVLVVWGPGFDEFPAGATRIAGTWVLRGAQRKEWPVDSIFRRFPHGMPPAAMERLLIEI